MRGREVPWCGCGVARGMRPKREGPGSHASSRGTPGLFRTIDALGIAHTSLPDMGPGTFARDRCKTSRLATLAGLHDVHFSSAGQNTRILRNSRAMNAVHNHRPCEDLGFWTQKSGEKLGKASRNEELNAKISFGLSIGHLTSGRTSFGLSIGRLTSATFGYFDHTLNCEPRLGGGLYEFMHLRELCA